MDIRAINSTSLAPAPAQTAGPGAVSPGATAAPRKPDAASVATPVTNTNGLEPNQEELAEAVLSINKAMENKSASLEFSVDSDSGRAVVKVIDKDTKELIRQMPTQEALEIAKSLETLQGLLAKQTA